MASLSPSPTATRVHSPFIARRPYSNDRAPRGGGEEGCISCPVGKLEACSRAPRGGHRNLYRFLENRQITIISRAFSQKSVNAYLLPTPPSPFPHLLIHTARGLGAAGLSLTPRPLCCDTRCSRTQSRRPAITSCT